MMNIAIALNRKYVKHTCVMLHSLFKNHLTTDVCVYVLHSELTEEDCKLMQLIQEQYLRGMLRFVYIEKELIPDDFPTTTFWTREMYYRLMLVDLLPASVTRILYLDIDMIVNKDITELYDMDFEGRSLIVSKDMEFENMMEHSCSGNAAHDRMFKQLQEEGHVYFCSGMVLFNIKKIREAYSFDKYLDIFKEIKEYMAYPDQDLLNYVHKGDVKYVDELTYGVFAQTAHTLGYSYQDIKQNASIIHFTGQAKPWTNNLIRYDIEKIWWEYAAQTPYYEELQEIFLDKMMDQKELDDYINSLLCQHAKLLEEYNQCLELMHKLVALKDRRTGEQE